MSVDLGWTCACRPPWSWCPPDLKRCFNCGATKPAAPAKESK